jgi:hypothetical protein
MADGIVGTAELKRAEGGVRCGRGEALHAVDPLLVVDGVVGPECGDAVFPIVGARLLRLLRVWGRPPSAIRVCL